MHGRARSQFTRVHCLRCQAGRWEQGQRPEEGWGNRGGAPNTLSTNVMGTSPTLSPDAVARTMISIWG